MARALAAAEAPARHGLAIQFWAPVVKPADYTPAVFTKEEEATLRKHGLAVYRDKLITKAQPPITDEQVATVEAKLTKPIPQELLALWRTSFGGSLDYVLNAAFGEHRYSASFSELFYPNSNHYRDLFGWIEHELELANEAEDEAEEEDEERPEIVHLPVLPFGGFEYLERLYVSLHEGHDGQVVLWAQGLPPAWKTSLTEDAVATLAQNVNELFDQLSLDEDPASKTASKSCTGTEMLEAVDELRAAAPELAAKLEVLIKKSVFDWRSQLAGSSYEGSATQQRALRLALKTAVADDDASLLERLNERGYPLDQAISGTSTVLAVAASHGAGNVLDALLDCGRPLGNAPIVFAKELTLDRVLKLIAADIAFDVDALFNVAAAGAHDAALSIVKDARHHGDWDNLEGQLKVEAKKAVENASRVDSGKLHSYLTADEYRAQAGHLRAFAKMLAKVQSKRVSSNRS